MSIVLPYLISNCIESLCISSQLQCQYNKLHARSGCSPATVALICELNYSHIQSKLWDVLSQNIDMLPTKAPIHARGAFFCIWCPFIKGHIGLNGNPIFDLIQMETPA
jgi:hypothetical protein